MKSTNSKIIGDFGERLALNYLEEKGFILIEQNWRCARAEVDLIMKRGDLLVFVEVKLRNTTFYGSPLEFVSEQKIDLLQKAASDYLEIIAYPLPIRFDVISILHTKANTKIEHFEDVF